MASLSPTPALLGGRFASGPRIGAGSFGEVFVGTDCQRGVQVAMKVEPASAKHGYLDCEVQAYRVLSQAERVPSILWDGRDTVGRRVMVTELLGPSLAVLFDFCGKRFRLKTTLLLARQMIECLEAVHMVGLVHRDLKPANFLIGLGPKSSTVHIIDFGLSTSWIDRGTRKHVPYREYHTHVGTALFSSTGSDFGKRQSRRDDVESLAYSMLFFLKGSLPWQHVQYFNPNDKDRLRAMADCKASVSVDRACQGQPAELATFLRYAKSLRFEECPDYTFLKNLLDDLFEERGYEEDGIFDWTILTQTLPRGRATPAVATGN